MVDKDKLAAEILDDGVSGGSRGSESRLLEQLGDQGWRRVKVIAGGGGLAQRRGLEQLLRGPLGGGQEAGDLGAGIKNLLNKHGWQ